MKSIEQRFTEALDELRKKGKINKFNEMFPYDPTGNSKPSVEVQLNRAEALLSGRLQEVEAAARTVKKHNGADDLFVEGSPFNRERSTNNGGRSGSFFTESAAEVRHREVRQTLEKVDRMIAESWFKAGKITEAEKNKLLGEDKPKGLTHLQETEYGLAVRMGLNESDALSLAKTPLLTEAWR
jgi:hypothetical protein